MNTVEPIRDTDIIAQIKWDLKRKYMRNYCMFLLGINSALRISDILKLQVGNMKISCIFE
ncbi:hypothetical protein ACFQZT_15085 [Paenibacillus sp. GCM10027628]|uniref:hypothetical protein n=1 Tax=Paenibacillus sp. GCM10027628 TaxID=3273413 RepID=UPI00363BC7C1